MSFAVSNTITEESTDNTIYKLGEGNYFQQSQSMWVGPPLNPTSFLPYNQTGNPEQNSATSFTFSEATGDTLFSFETYNIVNGALMLSAILPDFTSSGPAEGNTFRIGGKYIYANLITGNKIQFVVNNSNYEYISYTPGYLFYIYMDGVNANFIFVNTFTGITTSYVYQYLSNQSNEYLWYGFQNTVSTNFTLTIIDIYVRTSASQSLSYYNKSNITTIVTPFLINSSEVYLPFCDIIPFSLTGSQTITIIHTGILGRKITLINLSNYTATFSNGGANIYLLNGVSTTTVGSNKSISFIYSNFYNSANPTVFLQKWIQV